MPLLSIYHSFGFTVRDSYCSKEMNRTKNKKKKDFRKRKKLCHSCNVCVCVENIFGRLRNRMKCHIQHGKLKREEQEKRRKNQKKHSNDLPLKNSSFFSTAKIWCSPFLFCVMQFAHVLRRNSIIADWPGWSFSRSALK